MNELRVAVYRLMHRKDDEIGKIKQVSIRKPNILTWGIWWRSMGAIGAVAFFVSIWVAMRNHAGLASMIWIAYFAFVIWRLYKRMRNRFSRPRIEEQALQEFIIDNQLFETNADGRMISQIDMAFAEYPTMFSVYVGKNGDRYQRYASGLGEMLQARLMLPLYEVKESGTDVEYRFLKQEIERQQISEMPLQDSSLKIPVYDDYVINLRSNFSSLVSGASGAGKSFYTYFLLTRFISQTVNGKHAKLFIVDPKQSDLYKLAKTSKMPAENYGTSNADAFRIVRAFLAEMNERMATYEQSTAFNTVGVDIGMVPALLVLEEYSSLVASMDSKQKKEFEDMVAVIAQKSRSLSMGILIVMQQPRADSLSSNIREQLQNVVFLGNPSKESAGMLGFPSDLPAVSGKGVGYYSQERSEPKKFEAPIFEGDVFETILPVWQYVANEYGLQAIEEEPAEEPGQVDWNEFL